MLLKTFVRRMMGLEYTSAEGEIDNIGFVIDIDQSLHAYDLKESAFLVGELKNNFTSITPSGLIIKSKDGMLILNGMKSAIEFSGRKRTWITISKDMKINNMLIVFGWDWLRLTLETNNENVDISIPYNKIIEIIGSIHITSVIEGVDRHELFTIDDKFSDPLSFRDFIIYDIIKEN